MDSGRDGRILILGNKKTIRMKPSKSNMQRRIQIITIFVLVLLGASCKKFLQENPTNFLTPTSDFGSAKVARAMANAAYAQLQGLLAGQNSSYGGNTWNLMEFMTGKSNS